MKIANPDWSGGGAREAYPRCLRDNPNETSLIIDSFEAVVAKRIPRVPC